MKRVFVLQHTHDDEGHDEMKFIGVYATAEAAQAAVARLRSQPGFSLHPDGFCIDDYEIGKDHWTEGFDRWLPPS